HAVTARRPAWAALTTEPERDLVRALVEARLFVSELSGDVPGFGVTHEALLRRWPRVADWIERHRQDLQVRTRVTAQAERWAAARRPKDLLLPRGSQVNAGRGLLAATGVTLPPLAREFVQRSVNRVKLGQRIALGVMGLVVLLAVLAGVLGLRARAAQHEAERHRAEAESLMVFMLGDFADKLLPLGRLDLLDSVSAKALSYLTTVGDSDSLTARTQRAATLNMIAEVAKARGQPGKALTALQAAYALLAPHAADSADPEVLATLKFSATLLGQHYLDTNALDTADRYFQECLALTTRLAPRGKNGEHWNQLAVVHNSLGAVAKAREQPDKAALHFQTAVALNRRAVAANPANRSFAGSLANSLSWLAETLVLLKRPADAARLFAEESALLETLRRVAPDELLWTSRQAYSLWYHANVELDEGRRPAALALYRRARMLAADLVRRDPTNQLWQVDLVRLQMREIEAAPVTPAALDTLERLQRQSLAMRAAVPDNPDLGSLVAQVHDAIQAARARLPAR
ncbi:MAG TPA: transcriptional regulator, partial [Pseudoduganella sp.]